MLWRGAISIGQRTPILPSVKGHKGLGCFLEIIFFFSHRILGTRALQLLIPILNGCSGRHMVVQCTMYMVLHGCFTCFTWSYNILGCTMSSSTHLRRKSIVHVAPSSPEQFVLGPANTALACWTDFMLPLWSKPCWPFHNKLWKVCRTKTCNRCWGEEEKSWCKTKQYSRWFICFIL